MIDRIEAGRRLRDARKDAGFSQERAAERLGIRRTALSDLERGKRVPGWPRMVEIVTTLGLDPKQVVPEFFTKN